MYAAYVQQGIGQQLTLQSCDERSRESTAAMLVKGEDGLCGIRTHDTLIKRFKGHVPKSTGT